MASSSFQSESKVKSNNLLHPSMAALSTGAFSQSTSVKSQPKQQQQQQQQQQLGQMQAQASSSCNASVACANVALNKRGNPIYSRDDIREQYCINSKELQVFESGLSGNSNRLFGCLSTSHLPDGHTSCSKSEHLFSLSSCVRRKSSLDSIKKISSLGKRVEDEDDSDGGFKRRPKIRSSIAIDQRYSWTDANCAFRIPMSTSSHQLASTSVMTPCLPVRPPSVICYESSNQHRHYFQQPPPPPPVAASSKLPCTSSNVSCLPHNCATSPVPITYHRYIGSSVIHPIIDQHHQQYPAGTPVSQGQRVKVRMPAQQQPQQQQASTVKCSAGVRSHPPTPIYQTNVIRPTWMQEQTQQQLHHHNETRPNDSVDWVHSQVSPLAQSIDPNAVVTPPPFFASTSPLPPVYPLLPQSHSQDAHQCMYSGLESTDQHSIANLSMYTPTPSSYNSLRMVRRTTTVKTQATQTQGEIDAEIARATALELEYELNAFNREQSQVSSKYALSGDSQSGVMDGLHWTTTGTSYNDGESISRPRTQATETIGDYDDELFSSNLHEYIIPNMIDQSSSLDYLTLSPRATRKIIAEYSHPFTTGPDGRKLIKISASNRHPLGQGRQVVPLYNQVISDRQSTQLRPSTAAPETGQMNDREDVYEVERESALTSRVSTSHHRSNNVNVVTDKLVKHDSHSSRERDEREVNMQSYISSCDHSSELSKPRGDETGYTRSQANEYVSRGMQSDGRTIDDDWCTGDSELLNPTDKSSTSYNLNTSSSMNTISRKTRKLIRSGKSIRSIESTSPPSSACQSVGSSNVPHVTAASLDLTSNLSSVTNTTESAASSRRESESRSSKHRSHSRTSGNRHAISNQQEKDKFGENRSRAVSADDLGRGVESSSTSDSELPVSILPKLGGSTTSDRRHSLSTVPLGNKVSAKQLDDDQFFTFSRPIKLPSPSTSSTLSLKRSTGKLNTSEHSEEPVIDVKSILPYPVQEKLLLSEGIKLPSAVVSVRKVTQTVTLDKAREITKSLTNLTGQEDDDDDADDDGDDEEKQETVSTVTTAATLTDEISNTASLVSPDSETGQHFVTTAAVTTRGSVNLSTASINPANAVAICQSGSIASSSNYITATSASLDRASGTIETLTSVNTPFETVSSCTASYYSSTSSVGKVEAYDTSPKSSQEAFWSTGQQTPGHIGPQMDLVSSDTEITEAKKEASPASQVVQERSIDASVVSSPKHDEAIASTLVDLTDTQSTEYAANEDITVSTDQSQLTSRLQRASNNLPQLNLIKTASLPEDTRDASSPASLALASTSTDRRVKCSNSHSDLIKQSSFGDLSESTMATLAIVNSPSLGALSRSVENLDELPESETPGYEITSSDPSTTFDPTTILERTTGTASSSSAEPPDLIKSASSSVASRGGTNGCKATSSKSSSNLVLGSSELLSSPIASVSPKCLNLSPAEDQSTEELNELAVVTTSAKDVALDMAANVTEASGQVAQSDNETSMDRLQSEMETIITESIDSIGQSIDEQSNNMQLEFGSYLDGKMDDLSAFTSSNIYTRRTLSGELSTVSEVSEEMSNKTKTDLSISSTAPSSPALSGLTGMSARRKANHSTSKLATRTRDAPEERSPSSSSSDSSSRGSSSSSCGCNVLDEEEDVYNEKSGSRDVPSLDEDDICGEEEELAKGGTLKRRRVKGKDNDEDSSSGSFMLEKPKRELPKLPEAMRKSTSIEHSTEPVTHELNVISKEETDDSSFRYQDISKQSDDTSRSAATGEQFKSDKLHRVECSEGGEKELEQMAIGQATASHEPSESSKEVDEQKYISKMTVHSEKSAFRRDEDEREDEEEEEEGDDVEEEEAEEIEHELLMEDEVGAGGITVFDVESSQATERDFAKSEFSLEQQSSQELDEESFSGAGGGGVATAASLLTSQSLVSSGGSADRYSGKAYAGGNVSATHHTPGVGVGVGGTGVASSHQLQGNRLVKQASSESTKPDVTSGSGTRSSSSRPPLPSKSSLVLESKSRTLDLRRKDFLNERSRSHELPGISGDGTNVSSSGGQVSSTLTAITDVKSSGSHPSQSLMKTPAAVEAIITTGGTIRDIKEQLKSLGREGVGQLASMSMEASDQLPSQQQPPPIPPHRVPVNKTSAQAVPLGKVSPVTVVSDAQLPSGEAAMPLSTSLPSHSLHYPHRVASASVTFTLDTEDKDSDEDIGYYDHYYRSHIWLYINKKAELDVWLQRLPPSTGASTSTSSVIDKSSLVSTPSPPPPRPGSALATERPEDAEKTESEKCFVKQFESLTHRMIHRKATTVMYSKMLSSQFYIEKSVLVNRLNGEFGFRIHGSRPVVVSAIEKNTPAESSGLQVGDVIVALNDINVLDSAHSDIVKLAHSGPQSLRIDIVRTQSCLKTTELLPFNTKCIISGFLERRCREKTLKNAVNTANVGVACSTSTSTTTATSANISSSFTGSTAGDEVPSDLLTWRRRWFSLNSDLCLYWFRKPEDSEPLGVLKLNNCCASLNIPDENDDNSLYKLTISLNQSVTKDSSGDQCTSPSNLIALQVLAAKSADLALKWVTAINDASNSLSRSDPYLEVTALNSRLGATLIKEADCRGYLGKFSHLKKVWRQKYFVLKDAALYLFQEINATSAQGVIYLHGYKAQACAMVGKKNTFELLPPNSKLKHFWFMADSEADRKRWLASLEYSIDRWIKLRQP